jgi:hypothetical protein
MQGKHTVFDTRRVSLDDDGESVTYNAERVRLAVVDNVDPASPASDEKREVLAAFKSRLSLHLIRARA